MSQSARMLSRRGFCLCCIGAAAFTASSGWLTPSEVFAKAHGIVDMIRDSAAATPITTYEARGLLVLEGSGGNVLASSGSDGIVLIDAGIGVSASKVKKAVAKLGPQPIRHVVNTHWHFDHTDGNEWLAKGGAEIHAHRTTLAHLKSAQRVDDWDFDFPAAPPAALPTSIFGDHDALELNGDRLVLDHYGSAHTDGDSSVFFEKANVLHVADTFWNGIYPFIDYSTGGSIDGMIRAAETNVKTAQDDTIVVPGHGHPVSNRRELIGYRDMLVAIRSKVADLKSKGLSLEEATKRKPTKEFDAVWGKFVIGPDFFTKLVYMGV